jgi:regulator of nucleoside diphosphate kinase
LTGLNDTMFARPLVYATAEGRNALLRIAAHAQRSSPGLDLLEEELRRLTLVHSEDGGPHVQLKSRVIYKDLRTKRQRLVQVVEPAEAAEGGAEENRISILSPIGAALVGLKTGAIFRWQAPDGQLRAVKVLSVENETC